MDPYAEFLPHVLRTGKQVVQSKLSAQLALESQPRYKALGERLFQSAAIDID